MNTRAVARVWDGLWLALAFLPLAIFWTGRGDAFPRAAGAPDDTLLWHLGASALYVAAVALTIRWMHSSGRRGTVAGIAAFAALAGSVAAFQRIGAAALREGELAGLGFGVAVGILIWLSAISAAWIVLAWIGAAVRR